MNSAQYGQRWRPRLHLRPNAPRTHNVDRILQQRYLAVRGRRGAGNLWTPPGALCTQHQRALLPDAAAPQRAKKGMHADRGLAVRLRVRGSFQNCDRRACGWGFGAGKHQRGPVCCATVSETIRKPRTSHGPLPGTWGPPTRGNLRCLERPQQNWQAIGSARETDSSKGQRR